MEIGNNNYLALFHVLCFIMFLWILATYRKKDE
jgi:hypothetical protein